MSSEAITRNDLRAILNEVLPPTSSEYRKLLWTNPNPTSSFSAQTISLDLTGYDFIDIEMTANKSNAIFPTTTRLPTTGFSSGTWIQSYAESASNWAGYRRVTPSSTGVTFGNGGFAYFDSTTNNLNNNDYGIPLKIYGIKYERVAPPQLEVPQKIELLRVSSGLANTNYTLADNISNYDIISFVALSAYSNRWGAMVPTSVFAESTNNYHFYLGVETSVYNLALHYSNDITIGVAGHGTGTTGLVVTGFKL